MATQLPSTSETVWQVAIHWCQKRLYTRQHQDAEETNTMPRESIVNLNVRLPKSLHRRLQKDAAGHGVSLNTEILNRLGGAAALAAMRPELKMATDAVRSEWFDRAAEPGAPAQPSAADTAKVLRELQLESKWEDLHKEVGSLRESVDRLLKARITESDDYRELVRRENKVDTSEERK